MDITESLSLVTEMMFNILTLWSVWTRKGSDCDSVNKVRQGTEETLFAKITWFATDYAIYSKGID